jgi:hypothetical protein
VYGFSFGWEADLANGLYADNEVSRAWGSTRGAVHCMNTADVTDDKPIAV